MDTTCPHHRRCLLASPSDHPFRTTNHKAGALFAARAPSSFEKHFSGLVTALFLRPPLILHCHVARRQSPQAPSTKFGDVDKSCCRRLLDDANNFARPMAGAALIPVVLRSSFPRILLPTHHVSLINHTLLHPSTPPTPARALASAAVHGLAPPPLLLCRRCPPSKFLSKSAAPWPEQ